MGLVAELNGEPVGVVWHRLFTEAEHAKALSTRRRPNSRSQSRTGTAAGIGRALMEAIHERARSAGVTRTSLSVDEDNPAKRPYASSVHRVRARRWPRPDDPHPLGRDAATSGAASSRWRIPRRERGRRQCHPDRDEGEDARRPRFRAAARRPGSRRAPSVLIEISAVITFGRRSIGVRARSR